MTHKDILQLELYGAHSEAQREDRRHRADIHAKVQYLDRIGWFAAFGVWARQIRGEARFQPTLPCAIRPWLSWSGGEA